MDVTFREDHTLGPQPAEHGDAASDIPQPLKSLKVGIQGKRLQALARGLPTGPTQLKRDCPAPLARIRFNLSSRGAWQRGNLDPNLSSRGAWQRGNPNPNLSSRGAWRHGNPNPNLSSRGAWRHGNLDPNLSSRGAWRHGNLDPNLSSRGAWRHGNLDDVEHVGEPLLLRQRDCHAMLAMTNWVRVNALPIPGPFDCPPNYNRWSH